LHKDFFHFASPDVTLDLPEVPRWEQDTGFEGIVETEKVKAKLQPLLDAFEEKAAECRRRLQEGDVLLRNLQLN